VSQSTPRQGLSLWRLAFVVVDLVARFTSLGHDVRGRFWCSWLLRLTETRPLNRFELSGRSPQARKRPWLPRRWADLCSITADSVMRGTYRVWSSPAVSRETTTRPLSKLRAKSGETCAPMSPQIRSILLAKPGGGTATSIARLGLRIAFRHGPSSTRVTIATARATGSANRSRHGSNTKTTEASDDSKASGEGTMGWPSAISDLPQPHYAEVAR